jgi:selenoprotein W-related protein
MTRPVVRIAYCAECGYEEQALAVTRELVMGLGSAISSVTLIPWMDGTFDVSVDGQLVHSMARDGGFPEAGAVSTAIRERLEPTRKET